MTELMCSQRLRDLRELNKIYNRIYDDKYSSFYKSQDILHLKTMTTEEIERLEDLLNDLELEDSYDQNTGKGEIKQ